MHIDLNSKNILLTGASRGIGFAIAQQLLASGARVALHYHRNGQNLQQLQDQYPSQAFPFAADLAEVAEVDQLMQAVLLKFERLDVLINNAGIAIESPLLEGEEEVWLSNWERTMQVNLRAATLLSRHSVRNFLAHKTQGRLIHIASRAAFRGDTPEYIAYAASKGAMVAMSHSLARAFGKKGITSFALAPGFTQTDMAQDFIDTYGEDFAKGDILLPNLTQPKDIAPLVTLLASGKMDHATGTSISMNAGSYIR